MQQADHLDRGVDPHPVPLPPGPGARTGLHTRGIDRDLQGRRAGQCRKRRRIEVPGGERMIDVVLEAAQRDARAIQAGTQRHEPSASTSATSASACDPESEPARQAAARVGEAQEARSKRSSARALRGAIPSRSRAWASRLRKPSSR